MNVLKQKIQKLNLSLQTHEKLKFISKVTGISMTHIIEMFIEELFSLSVEYNHCTLSITSKITEDTCYAVLHGFGKKLSINAFKTDVNASDAEIDAETEKRLIAQAEKANNEVFNENEGLAREGI